MTNNAVFNYLSGAWSELKKVNWPTKQEVANHTIVVLISSIVAIAITAAIDYGLTYTIQYIVERKG